MEKKEVQKAFKDHMKKLGFRCRGNICYRYLTDDYLIFVRLEHSSYYSAYRVDYGAVYEADTMEGTFQGKGDWSSHFLFAKDATADLAQYSLEDLRSHFGMELDQDFDYSLRSMDDFARSLDINIEKRLNKLSDRSYVLDQYRKNWILFRKIPYDTCRKIARLAGLDAEEVIRIRDSKVTQWP